MADVTSQSAYAASGQPCPARRRIPRSSALPSRRGGRHSSNSTACSTMPRSKRALGRLSRPGGLLVCRTKTSVSRPSVQTQSAPHTLASVTALA